MLQNRANSIRMYIALKQKEIDYSGANFAACRKKKKLKQTDVCEKIGISRRNLQRIEAEEKLANGYEILALGALYGVTIKMDHHKLSSHLMGV